VSVERPPDAPDAGGDVTDAVAALLDTLDATSMTGTQRRLYRSMLDTVSGLAADRTEVIDLKVADSALAEMAEACPTIPPTGRPATWPVRCRRRTGWWSPGPVPG
jgi:hypothetical protein